MLKGQNDHIAIISGDKQLIYGDLKRNASIFSGLISAISKKRIAIFSENRLEWIYAFYATWVNDNIPVPIDHLAGIDDISFILNDCQPEVIFCSREGFVKIKQALHDVDYEPRVIVFEDIDVNPSSEVSPFEVTEDTEKTAVIIYTSGTTGSPKGVMLSFGNLIANMNAVSNAYKIYTPQQRVMMLLPLHHIFPLLGSLIVPLYVGGTVVMCPTLNADDIIRTLQQHKVTMLIGVPRLYSIIHKGITDKINQSGIARLLFKLAASLKWRSFSKKVFKQVHEKFGGHLEFIISGGAPLDPIVADGFNTLGFEILEGYGMTEAAPMITFTRPNSFCKGSAGQALPGTKVDVRDGEIVASGPNIMQGYYNRPEETSAILMDGWLYTGDLGKIDEKGRIFITGRKKEIIVLSNGKNINPSEIELKIEKTSAAIKEAAVFLMKDKLNLIIVPDETFLRKESVTNVYEYIKSEVLSIYNERASSSKKIFKLHISYDELPKTRLSKIQRFKLEGFVQALSPQKTVKHEAIDSKELQTIIDFIAQQIGQDVFPEDRLTDDLALDSLSKITLIVYLENTFGVKIEEEELMKFHRVRDLSNFIIEHKTRHQHEKINWSNILKERVHFKTPKPGISFTFSNISYKTLLKSLFRIRPEGSANIPDGPCILAPNHQSFLDGFIVAASLRRNVMRKTFIYAKEKHWRSSFKRFIARKNNVILMDINKDLKLSLQKMAEVLRKGQKIIIFPEGTRSKDGEMSNFKQTFAILAKELNIPIVPVAIKGANDVMPVGKIFPRLFKKVSIQFMKPVYPEGLSYDSLKEKVQRLVAGQLV